MSKVCAASNFISQTKSWHYEIAPYGWASSIDGDVIVKNRTAQVHIPFKDIVKHLDFAAQGHFEAGYGPWSLMLDPTYLKVTDKHQLRWLGLRIKSKTVLVDAGLFYQVFATKTARGQLASFELLGGSRYLNIKNTLDFGREQFSSKIPMNTPIAGARFKLDVTPRKHLWLRGDVGGFHVDHVNKTWSATLGYAYSIKNHIDLGLAYRALKIDYNKHDSAMNILMHGPEVGVSIHD